MADLTAPDLNSVPTPTPAAPQAASTLASMFGIPTKAPDSTIAMARAPAVIPPTMGLTQEDEDWKARHSGAGGTIHDILGGLGDFLLTHLHLPALYAKSQEDHKLNYAFDQGGQSSNPADQLHAINLVQNTNFNEGAKLRDQFIDNQRLQAAQASTAEARDGRLAMAKEAADTKTRGYAASMLGTMANWDDARRQQYYPALRDQVINAGKRQGLDLSSELPEQFDANTIDAFTSGAVPVTAQRAQLLTKDKNENNNQLGNDKLAESVRNHDFQHEDRLSGQATTMRGQDIHSSDAAANRSASGDRNDARIAARTAYQANKVQKARPTGADITYLRNNPGVRDRFDGNFGVGMSKRILGN